MLEKNLPRYGSNPDSPVVQPIAELLILSYPTTITTSTTTTSTTTTAAAADDGVGIMQSV